MSSSIGCIARASALNARVSAQTQRRHAARSSRAARVVVRTSDEAYGGEHGDLAPALAPLKEVSVSPVARDYAALSGAKITVDFEIHYEAVFGQEVQLLGSHDALGAWDQGRAVTLSWNQGDVWTASVELPAGGIFFYKYVVRDSEGRTVRWQDGSNSMLVLPESWNMPRESHYLVEDNFAGVPGEATDASENLLASKLSNVHGEKKVLLDQLQMQKHMTQTALEELLLAREDLAQAQSKLLSAGNNAYENNKTQNGSQSMR